MKLSEYIKTHNITPADLARLLGAKSRSTAYRYLSGTRKKPSQEMMQRISEATGGAVTANDFYDIEPINGHKRKQRQK